MRSPPDVARFVGSVAAVATSAASAEDRIEAVIDEVARVLPFVGMCINASPDAGGRSGIVYSRDYPDRILGWLGSSDFLEEWRGLRPSAIGTRLKEVWDVDPLPVTVRDFIVPLGFGGGVSIPLSTSSGMVVGGMHFSTERAEDISDLAHYGLCLIAPTLNNLVGSLPPRSQGAPLSGREREVLELIARGKSNAEIADDLFISQRTAATHVEHILSKLGASNRAHAAVLGVQFHLIPAN